LNAPTHTTGGEILVDATSEGADTNELFASVGHSNKAFTIMKELHIGELVMTEDEKKQAETRKAAAAAAAAAAAFKMQVVLVLLVIVAAVIFSDETRKNQFLALFE
jgi:hypothetical protein